MRKRTGFVRIHFDDGTFVDRPISPDKKAIPHAGGGFEGEPTKWHERDEDAAARAEWYEMQDRLDEAMRTVNSRKGGEGGKGRAAEDHKTWISLATAIRSRNKHASARSMANTISGRDDVEHASDTIARVLKKNGF